MEDGRCGGARVEPPRSTAYYYGDLEKLKTHNRRSSDTDISSIDHTDVALVRRYNPDQLKDLLRVECDQHGAGVFRDFPDEGPVEEIPPLRDRKPPFRQRSFTENTHYRNIGDNQESMVRSRHESIRRREPHVPFRPEPDQLRQKHDDAFQRDPGSNTRGYNDFKQKNLEQCSYDFIQKSIDQTYSRGFDRSDRYVSPDSLQSRPDGHYDVPKEETYSTAGTFPMPEPKEKEPLLAELEIVGRVPLVQLDSGPGVRRSRSWYLCCPVGPEEDVSRESSWRYSSLRPVTAPPVPQHQHIFNLGISEGTDGETVLRAERDSLRRALAAERARAAAASRAHDARLAELHGVIAELVRRRTAGDRARAIPEEDSERDSDACDSTTQPAGDLDNDADHSRTDQNDSSSVLSPAELPIPHDLPSKELKTHTENSDFIGQSDSLQTDADDETTDNVDQGLDSGQGVDIGKTNEPSEHDIHLFKGDVNLSKGDIHNSREDLLIEEEHLSKGDVNNLKGDFHHKGDLDVPKDNIYHSRRDITHSKGDVHLSKGDLDVKTKIEIDGLKHLRISSRSKISERSSDRQLDPDYDTSLNLSDKDNLKDCCAMTRSSGCCHAKSSSEFVRSSDCGLYERKSTSRCDAQPRVASRVRLRRTEDPHHITGGEIASDQAWSASMVEQLAGEMRAHGDLGEVLAAATTEASVAALRVAGARCERLQADCAVLESALAEAVHTGERLWLACGQHEAWSVCLCVALRAADRALEVYDVLLALAESCRDTQERTCTELVARRLLARLDLEEAAGHPVGEPLMSPGPWLECAAVTPSEGPWSEESETRLRQHAARLKSETACVRAEQAPVPLHSYTDIIEAEGGLKLSSNSLGRHHDMETAVLMQEVASAREERAAALAALSAERARSATLAGIVPANKSTAYTDSMRHKPEPLLPSLDSVRVHSAGRHRKPRRPRPAAETNL